MLVLEISQFDYMLDTARFHISKVKSLDFIATKSENIGGDFRKKEVITRRKKTS